MGEGRVIRLVEQRDAQGRAAVMRDDYLPDWAQGQCVVLQSLEEYE